LLVEVEELVAVTDGVEVEEQVVLLFVQLKQSLLSSMQSL
jgi:hypothetical protein